MNANTKYDLIGKKFERWTVIKHVYVQGKNHLHVRLQCQCDCGNIKNVDRRNLLNGSSKSCGCLSVELTKVRNSTHGKSGIKEYKAWNTLIARCCNPNSTSYPDYGAKGIEVCIGYRNSFENFISDVGAKPTPKHTIDRKDNDLNYSCGKCSECKEKGWEMNIHWGTYFEQNKNRGDFNHWIEYNGENMIVAEWARKLNVSPSVFSNYIRRGHSDLEAVIHYSNPNWNRLKRNSFQNH